MILPVRSKNPPETFPGGTILLIAINVIVYACTSNGWVAHQSAVKAYGLSLHNAGPLTLVTSMFLHGSILHLLGNMWFLYLLGFAVEGRLRSYRFIPMYLVAGALGSAAHLMIFGRAHPDGLLLGASGAIMGVLGAALYMFPYGQVDVWYYFNFWWRGTFTIPMWGVALWYLGFDLLWTFVGMDGVAHLAHLGGAAAGFLICALLRPKRDSEQVSESRATLADTKDLSLLTPRELQDLHEVNPTDDAIVLNWMHRSIGAGRSIAPECKQAFMRALPKLLQNQEPGSVAFCLATLAQEPGEVSARYMLHAASEMERINDAGTAWRLYDCVLRDPNSEAADKEAATYRVGMMCESIYKDHARASAWYQSVIDQWPMSPLAEQARSRLRVLTRV